MAMRHALSRACGNRLAQPAHGATRSFSSGKWSAQDTERERAAERRKHEADGKKAEQDREAAGRLNLFATLSNNLGGSRKRTKEADGSGVAGQDSSGDSG